SRSTSARPPMPRWNHEREIGVLIQRGQLIVGRPATAVRALMRELRRRAYTIRGLAVAFAILLVPFCAIGPFAGVFIDRWSRRRILVLTPLVRACALLLLAVGPDAAVPFYAGALLAVSANRFFLSTAGAVMPRVVRFDDLLVGNSAATVGGTTATALGTFAGGLLADSAGTGPVMVAIGGLWLLASWLASRIGADLTAPRQTAARIHREIRRVAAELSDGLRRLRRTPRALVPIVSISWDQFLEQILLIVSVVVFKERFQEGVGSYSWLVAAGAAGLLIGLTTVGPLNGRLSKPAIVAVAFAISGAGMLAVAGSITRTTVLIAAFVIGLSYAWKKIPVDTMVQEAVPDEFRGRVFAIYDVGFNIARVLAGTVALMLIPATGAPTALALAGAGFLLWIAPFMASMRKAPELLVRFYSGGKADEVPRSVVRGGDEEKVEMERSWVEERGGARLLCFTLRVADGSVLDVSRPEAGGEWSLDSER
ncbi:MAG: MFS transporter, partial [Actinomycetota bacterium]